MRILCLHGQGTSAYIFKSQTGALVCPCFTVAGTYLAQRRGGAGGKPPGQSRSLTHTNRAPAPARLSSDPAAIRAKLPTHYAFEYVDAPFPCAPAPGVRVLYETGHFTWWREQSVAAIRDAHRWLDAYMAEHGPYDAVMGFSQGCALVGSYLLYRARERRPAPLRFRSAVFVCGGMPLGVLEDLGVSVSARAHEVNEETVRLMKERAGALSELAQNPEQIRPGVGLWDDTTGLLHDAARLPSERDVFGLDFTAMPADLRIRIPTVHVYGAKDPRWPASIQLAYFCDNRRMYDHGGGHDIPRSTEVSDTIAEMLKQLSTEI